jgi:thiol:disulfide interchange protein DsbA
MSRLPVLFASILTLSFAPGAFAAETWKQGINYFLVTPTQQTNVAAGKIEVLEVFSYGCPACNSFLPTMQKLKAALPANAQIAYLPASFIPVEDWPMFQRAFFAAQSLGVVDRTHDAVFDAVWKTGELSIYDPATRRLKNPLPSIDDAAKFYASHAGVKREEFLNVARSFSVDTKMSAADRQVIVSKADRTPTIVVNGKYRLHAESAGGEPQLIDLVKWLVAKESSKAQ